MFSEGAIGEGTLINCLGEVIIKSFATQTEGNFYFLKELGPMGGGGGMAMKPLLGQLMKFDYRL